MEAGGLSTQERSVAAPAATGRRDARLAGVRALATDYVALTKPRVVSLLLVTTVATMFVAGDGRPSVAAVVWTLIGGYLAAGGANAINHYMDRDIDLRMARTRSRPLPGGRLEPRHALWFGIALGALSFGVFAAFVNVLAGALALLGLLLYVFLYTMLLKRTTPQNIVIGGAAGAMPPLVGWAAATGGLDWASLYLFAIVFYWTPPHFWALSLLIKDDYAASGVPMLPVVRGEDETRRQILLYTLLMVAVTVLPVAGQLFGAFYLVTALALGGVFTWFAVRLRRRADRRAALRLYLYSLAYLALLFGAMVIDKAL